MSHTTGLLSKALLKLASLLRMLEGDLSTAIIGYHYALRLTLATSPVATSFESTCRPTLGLLSKVGLWLRFGFERMHTASAPSDPGHKQGPTSSFPLLSPIIHT